MGRSEKGGPNEELDPLQGAPTPHFFAGLSLHVVADLFALL
jgi:hypothetical protein